MKTRAKTLILSIRYAQLWLGWKAESSFNFSDALTFLPLTSRNPECAIINFGNRSLREFIQLQDQLVSYAIGLMDY
jgi:hypothetical protein